MEFGMPTLIEAAELESCAALCRELGLDFIELNMNLPQYQPDAFDADAAERIARAYGVGYTLHLDENLNVCDFNPYVAEAYRRTVRGSIALAKRLHMPVLNLHMCGGVYFTLPEKKVYLFDVYRDRYLRDMRAFRDECEREIGGADVTLCVENCSGFTAFERDAIELLLQSPVFALTLDAGHSHGCGGVDEAFIASHGARLRHMHLHDAQGRKNHLPLGTGELDVENMLALAKQKSCRVVLETKTVAGLTQSVRWVREHGWL